MGVLKKKISLKRKFNFSSLLFFFNRPMASLAAKIPTMNLRLEILRNVWEEHGEGDASKAHENTFLIFLKRLGGITSIDINKKTLWPEIRIFNTCLTGACVVDDYMVATAMMGMIELMFCDISSIIGKGIVHRKWLTPETMIHYNLHAELDIKHSQDFFNVLSESWTKSEENKYNIEQGLRLGATLFNNLYTGLYEQRKRRLGQPHSSSI